MKTCEGVGELDHYMRAIKALHVKFERDHKTLPEVTEEEKRFRLVAMREEAAEYFHAQTDNDRLDALVDIVVFALGTVERHGWSFVFKEAFDRVMDANMKKVPGPNAERGNFKLDLKKPKGWQKPDHTDLVLLEKR